MRTLRAWLVRAMALFGSARSEREFEEELESHLQLHIDDNLRSGMTPSEARRQALMALGGLSRTQEEYRDRRGIPAVESIARDLGFGARTLVKSPGFTLAAILILGLGIGVNSAIFTVVNAVILRPLPFPDADRILRVWHTPPRELFAGRPVFALSPANFIDWRDQNQVFERMAIYRIGRQTLTGQGEPDAVRVARASSDFLPILGLSPALGRGFTQEDDSAGGPKTALLSDALWRSRFGADPGVIGRPIVLDGVPHAVIGVVPDAPAFVDTIQIWLPLAWTAEERAVRGNHNYRGIAKLKAGLDVARAQTDMNAISKRLEQQYPEDNRGWGALVLPLHEDLVGDVRPSLMVLLGAVALVLLIACANLANLMLTRTYGRAKEIALRAALGASRWRVTQQLLGEGLLLGAGGGAVGFLAAIYAVGIFVAVFQSALPRASEIALDGRVLGFTALIAISTGLLAALVPAWNLTRRDAHEELKRGAGRGNSSRGDGRIRRLLVVSEVALAITLLVGAGLLLRSLAGLRAVDAGFDASHVLTATVDVPDAKYPRPEERIRFFDRALENIRSLPLVESAALVDTLPLQGGSSQYVAAEGAPPVPDSERPVVAVRVASPEYFQTARIPRIAGRDFSETDRMGRPLVAIVSELAAERFWPNESPLGKHVTLLMMSDEPREVVGIVGEVKTDELDEREPETAIYIPSSQVGYSGATLVVRTRVAPESVTRAIVGAVRAIDPEQPVLDVMTMQNVVEESLGHRRFAMILLSAFAGLALILASVGIYSVLAYAVRQRVREIGICMALGAPSAGVLRMILIEGLKPTLLGVAIGLGLAASLVRVMSALLFGVSAHDPGTFGAVALIVVLVGLIAMLVPAYRATRIDPIATLRSE